MASEGDQVLLFLFGGERHGDVLLRETVGSYQRTPLALLLHVVHEDNRALRALSYCQKALQGAEGHCRDPQTALQAWQEAHLTVLYIVHHYIVTRGIDYAVLVDVVNCTCDVTFTAENMLRLDRY